MRRLPVAILLITIIFLQIGGMWMIYTTAIVLHRQQKALRLGDVSKRVELTLDASTYAACLIEENEICYRGMHYDVLSISLSNEVVRVLAVPDPAENKLHRTLENIRHQSTGWSALAHLANDFSQCIYIPSSPIELELASRSIEELSVFPPTGGNLCRLFYPEHAHPPC
jgi:hypothetical protein